MQIRHETLDKEVQNVVEAAVWDQELELASSSAIERLNAELGYSVLSIPKLGLLGGFGGGTPKVVQQMTTIFRESIVRSSHECSVYSAVIDGETITHLCWCWWCWKTSMATDNGCSCCNDGS